MRNNLTIMTSAETMGAEMKVTADGSLISKGSDDEDNNEDDE